MNYLNEIENRITFKKKTIYYLELLMPKTMKLLWSTKSKINKDENSENVPHLEITEDSRIKNQESRFKSLIHICS